MLSAPAFLPGVPPGGFVAPPAPAVSRPPAGGNPAPRPVVRMQGPDEPAPTAARPAPLTMPSPEQLGVGGVDWNQVDCRLRELGVTCSQRQRLAEGGYRFLVLLPATQPDRVQRVEAVAATETEAVQKALDKVAELKARGAN